MRQSRRPDTVIHHMIRAGTAELSFRSSARREDENVIFRPWELLQSQRLSSNSWSPYARSRVSSSQSPFPLRASLCLALLRCCFPFLADQVRSAPREEPRILRPDCTKSHPDLTPEALICTLRDPPGGSKLDVCTWWAAYHMCVMCDACVIHEWRILFTCVLIPGDSELLAAVVLGREFVSYRSFFRKHPGRFLFRVCEAPIFVDASLRVIIDVVRDCHSPFGVCED